MGHPRTPQDRPHRLPLAEPQVHRPGGGVHLRSRRSGARGGGAGGRQLLRRTRRALHPPRRPLQLRGPRRGVPDRRSRRPPACADRARGRRRRGPRRDTGVARVARRRRGLPLPHPRRRPPPASSRASRLRRPLRLVPAPGRSQLTHSSETPTPDAARIIRVQALRAVAYGAGSVLIGVSLDSAGLSGLAVGAILASLLVGSALASIVLGRYGDRIGRRRCYRMLLVVMAVAGTGFAPTTSPPPPPPASSAGTTPSPPLPVRWAPRSSHFSA